MDKHYRLTHDLNFFEGRMKKRHLPNDYDCLAPDGSEVRLLVKSSRFGISLKGTEKSGDTMMKETK